MASKNKFFDIEKDVNFFDEESESFKYCKKCRAKNSSTAKFCLECGSNEFIDKIEKKKNSNAKYCADCKTQVDTNAKFCHNCGSKNFVDSLEKIALNKKRAVETEYEKEYGKLCEKISSAKSKIMELDNEIEETKEKIVSLKNSWEEKIAQATNDYSNNKNKVNKFSSDSNGYSKKIEKLKEQISSLEKEYESLVGTDKFNQKMKAYAIKYEESHQKTNTTKIKLENLPNSFDFGDLSTKYDNFYKEMNKSLTFRNVDYYLKEAKMRSNKYLYTSAREFYEKAAVLGNLDAQNLCGVYFFYSNYGGSNATLDKGLYWFFKAAISGHSTAQNNLANAFYEGKGVKQDYLKALYWFKKVVNNKETANFSLDDAMYKIAYCYENGYGLTKDLDEAIKWYEKSSKNAGFDAKKALYRIYYNKKDYTKAFDWAKKATNSKEDGEMCFALAEMYSKGYGTGKDLNEAFKYYMKSANSGYAKGCYQLALCYIEGKGTPISKPNAKSYLEKAKSLGYSQASKLLREWK